MPPALALPLVLECPPEDRALLLYALRTIFRIAGYDVEPPSAAGTGDARRPHVYCGPAGSHPSACRLALPTAPVSAWRESTPEVVDVEGVPVLFIGERPQ